MSMTPMLDLVLPPPRLPGRSVHARASAVVTIALHAGAAVAITTLALGDARQDRAHDTKLAATESMQVPRLIFLQMPGPGGGGGGGGNRQPSPPSRAQNVGTDSITLPVARPVRVESSPVEAMPSQLVVLPSVPLASGFLYPRGGPDVGPSLALSQGPGVGDGAGSGSGTGIGSGKGPGFGPGSGGGFGGGVYQPGNGVIAPTVRSQVLPTYTPEAMHRRIQGSVVLEMIVGADGVPYNLRVVRSLDSSGLDEEAIRSAKEWRFNPGRLGDTPVDVLVILIIDFHIR